MYSLIVLPCHNVAVRQHGICNSSYCDVSYVVMMVLPTEDDLRARQMELSEQKADFEVRSLEHSKKKYVSLCSPGIDNYSIIPYTILRMLRAP